jgi:hypothetical protein
MFLPEANPSLCAIECASESMCLSWTYVNPGVLGSQAKCFLKHTEQKANLNECCTSGLKTDSSRNTKTVVFENDGFGPYEIYVTHNSNNARIYIGGVAAGAKTIPIPTKNGDRWEFKVPDGAFLESYTASNQPIQQQKMNGYRLNAQEPQTSFLRKLAGDVKRYVDGGARNSSQVIQGVIGSFDGSIGRLESQGKVLTNQIINSSQYKQEIGLLIEHVNLLVSATPDLSSLAYTAMRNGDVNKVKSLIQLGELANKLLRLQNAITAGDAASQPALMDKQAAYVVTFSPMVFDTSFVGGGTYEKGYAWPLTARELGLPSATYSAWSYSAGLSAGADFSVELGVWFVNALREIDGNGHGVTLGASVYAGAAATFWFTYDGLEFGQFVGVTISPQVGTSAELEYVRGTTTVNAQ